MRGAGATSALATVLAVVVLVVVVLLGVVAATLAHAQHLRAAQAELVRDVPARYEAVRARYGTPQETVEAVAGELRPEGWRLLLSPPRPGRFEGPPPLRAGPPGPRAGASGIGALAALVGVTPVRVPLADTTLEIAPDLAGFAQALTRIGVGALLALALGGVGIWRLALAARRAAFEPLVQTTAALRRLAGADFTPRLIVTDDRSPVGDLARAYNAAAEQVAAAIRAREKAEAEMQRFLADAGHELRTPVTIVLGYLDVLQGAPGDADPTSTRVVHGMRAEMDRMRGLVEKLIVLSRLESTPAAAGVVDVVAVVAGVRESAQMLAGERAIAVDAPAAAEVTGDENDVHEAVFNLVENALKYAPASDVRVTVHASERAVTVAVADDGPGMDAVDMRRAFERFYRGAARSGVPGSGLGLAIVKRAVERCGGSVSASSTPGRGACFTIELPRPTVALGAAT